MSMMLRFSPQPNAPPNMANGLKEDVPTPSLQNAICFSQGAIDLGPDRIARRWS